MLGKAVIKNDMREKDTFHYLYSSSEQQNEDLPKRLYSD